MDINKFLEKYIEGYLFSDLENMCEIKRKPGQKYGLAGYPVIQAVSAGVEFLGILDSTTAYSYKNGNDYFINYWENYLGEVNEKYKVNKMAELVRKLVRHGVDHTFFTKPGIGVSKNFTDEQHMDYDSSKDNILFINHVTLANDFIDSYNYHFKPNLNDPNFKENAQSQLNKLLDDYERDASEAFKNLPEKSTPYMKSFLSGASTSPNLSSNVTISDVSSVTKNK